MLNKDVCKECWNKDIGWDEFDETRWNEKGWNFCRAMNSLEGGFVDIDKEAPLSCYYRLEHLLKGKSNE